MKHALLVILCIFSLPSQAWHLSAQQRVLDSILHNGDDLNISLWVQDLNQNKPLFVRNTRKIRTPASVQKLFTASAALQAFGADFTFNTTLRAWHPPKQRQITGPVQLIFSGDPSLSHSDLASLFKQLHHAGVGQINGQLTVDDTRFDQAPYGPGWMWDELDDCYAAPLSTGIVDKNCFSVSLSPARRLNQPAKLTFSTPIHHKFISHVRTLAQKDDSCEFKFDPLGKDHFILNGCVRWHHRPEHLQVAIKQPRQHLRQQIQQALKVSHIELNGPIRFGHARKPKEAGKAMIFVHRSPPLKELLTEMLKKSDNLIADSLFKSMAHHLYHHPGSWQLGKQALLHYLPLSEHDLAHAELYDGAGLSRYNALSVQQVGLLLKKINQTPALRDTLVTALPNWGIDGTLKHRQDHALRDKVHAKTGGMHGICNLAGFINSEQHHEIAFVIFIQGDTQDHDKIHALQREFLHLLYQL